MVSAVASVLSLAVLAGTVFGAANTTTTLTPVVAGSSDPLPSTNVSLNYGLNDTSLVHVGLAMTYPTVLLEEIEAISAVDCTSSSVAVTFNNTNALAAAVAAWTETLVLVTNHLGDCDAELERAFFLASSFTSDEGSLTITAAAEKKNVTSTAHSTEITFSNVPAGTAKRGIVVNDTGVEITGSVSLPSTVTLYSYAPYVTVKADAADIDVAITLSGYLKYTILDGTLEAFYVDIDTALSADLTLEVDVNAAYSTNFTYSPGSLTYTFVDVPGIITIGPALDFGIGVELAAEGAVTVTGGVGAAITDGSIHLDFANENNTSTSGWTPTYSASLNISEAAAVSVDPYVDVTVELEFNLLSGALDLSGGITAQPKFNVEFELTAAQDVSGTGVSQPTSTASSCSQGVEIVTEFEFSVICFVTQFWSDTLYSVTVPIVDECYSWL